MAIEGELVVRLDCDGGEVKRAEARAQRPRIARQVLAGRSPEQATQLVSTLFAICGRSQGVAAAAATDAACSRELPQCVSAARERRVVAETVHEHSWRVLVDWPGFAGREPQTAALRAVRKALGPWLDSADGALGASMADVAAIARQAVFGRDAGEWLAIADVDEWEAWWRAGETPVAQSVADLLRAGPALGASDVELLAPMDAATLALIVEPALCAQDDFEDAPHWQGAARETGALARMQSHPLVGDAIARWGRGVGARCAARLVELAQLVQWPGNGAPARHGAGRTQGGAGLSWVETSRGLLLHRAKVEGGKVSDYRIVAPTEWNFHPGGPFVRAALGLKAESRQALRDQASRIVASLDPCVAWRVEVGHA